MSSKPLDKSGEFDIIGMSRGQKIFVHICPHPEVGRINQTNCRRSYLGRIMVFKEISSFPTGIQGFLGAGNNPMVGMTVSVAVAVEESLKK